MKFVISFSQMLIFVSLRLSEVIRDLDLNFNLYTFILLRGAEVSNNILILSKHILLELPVQEFSTNPPHQQKNSQE